MLAMRDGEAFVMVGLWAMVIGIVWLGVRHKYRCERLRTIQKAIEAGSLDEATRRAILGALAGDAQRRGAIVGVLFDRALRLVRTLLFVGGWLTLVIGGGVWVAMGASGGGRHELEGPMIATCVGFALVTMPLALRELDGRRAAARQ